MIRHRYCDHCNKFVSSEGNHTCRPSKGTWKKGKEVFPGLDSSAPVEVEGSPPASASEAGEEAERHCERIWKEQRKCWRGEQWSQSREDFLAGHASATAALKERLEEVQATAVKWLQPIEDETPESYEAAAARAVLTTLREILEGL